MAVIRKPEGNMVKCLVVSNAIQRGISYYGLNLRDYNVVVQFIFSSDLQIWYVEVWIARSTSNSSLHFEITRVDCTRRLDIGTVSIRTTVERILVGMYWVAQTGL